MKKFAKYLTVEGEIEVPCIVLETLTNGKTELFQVDNFNDINLETQKLAKLFLCSRDIQVGDKVQKNPSNWLISDFDSWGRGDGLAEVLEIIDDSTIDVRWEGGRCYETPNEVLKVIGEISPKAVWVTEGMEFDEDEIGFFIAEIFDEESENDSIIDYKTWSKTEGIKYIGIKCPTCKQFH